MRKHAPAYIHLRNYGRTRVHFTVSYEWPDGLDVPARHVGGGKMSSTSAKMNAYFVEWARSQGLKEYAPGFFEGMPYT